MRWGIAVVAALAALPGGCGQPERARTAGGEPEPSAERRLVVFAATSLREAFTELGAAFERAHGGLPVSFQFAGTQELRAQLEHGAPADVFASADTRHMDELVRARRVGAPVTFARNEPVVVVSREAAPRIRALRDLPAARRIVIGAPEVPIGRYTAQILDRAGLTERVAAKVASRELNVRQVLAKVALGEAEAGIVYRTDARAAEGGVSIVPIPADVNAIADYPIAVVTGAAHPRAARAFVDLVVSPEGRRALAAAGFLPGDAAP